MSDTYATKELGDTRFVDGLETKLLYRLKEIRQQPQNKLPEYHKQIFIRFPKSWFPQST